jgi:hypothetical protein
VVAYILEAASMALSIASPDEVSTFRKAGRGSFSSGAKDAGDFPGGMVKRARITQLGQCGSLLV